MEYNQEELRQLLGDFRKVSVHNYDEDFKQIEATIKQDEGKWTTKHSDHNQLIEVRRRKLALLHELKVRASDILSLIHI